MQLEVYYHLHSSSLLVPSLSHFSLCEYLFCFYSCVCDDLSLLGCPTVKSGKLVPFD
jgi:hypothetical protein